MGQFTTLPKKKEDTEKKTAQISDFFNRTIESNRNPENYVELPKTESPK